MRHCRHICKPFWKETSCCKHCDSTNANKGHTYDSVSKTQKQRKLKELKTNAEKSLWFLETFGLKLDSLSLIALDGEKVNLQYNGSQKSAYQILSDEDKDRVKIVVYIMDTFCVSDAAYHEFSMIDQEGIVQSYLIKQCKHALNRLYTITRTPVEWPGAQLSFTAELKHQISKQVSTRLHIDHLYA